MEIVQQTEIQQFQHFLVDRPQETDSLDEAVRNFRRYQEQVAKLREMVQEARDQIARGEVAPLDAEDTIRRLRERIDAAKR